MDMSDRDFTEEERETIMAAIQGKELTPKQQEFWETIRPVFEAEDELSPEDQETQNHLMAAAREDELQIVRAFTKLLERLPDNLKNVENWLQHLPLRHEDHVEYLRDQHFYEMGRPYTEMLAKYGLTPIDLCIASQSIRFIFGRQGRIPFEVSKRIDRESRRFKNEQTHMMLVHEIGDLVECDDATAGAILNYLVEIAKFEPFIFPGFEVKSANRELLITPASPNTKSVWKTTEA